LKGYTQIYQKTLDVFAANDCVKRDKEEGKLYGQNVANKKPIRLMVFTAMPYRFKKGKVYFISC